MKIITFANNKGGSAKTTTTTTVAHGLTLMLQKSNMPNTNVLVVDTDSQAHSTLLLTGRKDYAKHETLAGVLSVHDSGEDAEPILRNAIVRSTWNNNLHVLPAHTALDDTEQSLVGRSGNVHWLRRILNKLADDYALILIDTCPKFSLLTEMALLASNDVMIPVAPQYLDADGLLSMINKVYNIRNEWERSEPNVTGIIVAKFSSRVNGHNEIRDGIAKHPDIGNMYLGTVPLNSEIEYSHAYQKSIFEYNPNCKGAQAYIGVIQEIAKLVFVRT